MKEILGGLAVALSVLAYIPYIRDIVAGKTRPHAVSWLIWMSVGVIVLAGQIVDGGGPGAWLTALVTMMTTVIFVFAIIRGERSIKPTEVACLAAAVLAGIAWLVTDGPLTSVVIATVIDFAAFVPTFHKSFRRPQEETIESYALIGLAFGLSIAALDNVTVVTALSPTASVVFNAAMVTWLLQRRRIVAVQSLAHCHTLSA